MKGARWKTILEFDRTNPEPEDDSESKPQRCAAG
jgi:hypothetical protein